MIQHGERKFSLKTEFYKSATLYGLSNVCYIFIVPETSKPGVEPSIFELNSRNPFEEDVRDIEGLDDISSAWGYEVDHSPEGDRVLAVLEDFFDRTYKLVEDEETMFGSNPVEAKERENLSQPEFKVLKKGNELYLERVL